MWRWYWRMCRITLNNILLKYYGLVTSFGGSEEERRAYRDLAQRASRKVYEEYSEVAKTKKKQDVANSTRTLPENLKIP
ncbi:hypothetical protein F5Y18DRAFT_403339 [Xylariaceae sp. FL1019]|nr:hypothetical protein F5Y18DRAFT_403339 [Xylariaceae sp. FL1019]